MHRLILSDQIYDVKNAADEDEVLVVFFDVRSRLDEALQFVFAI